jgi:hypothetical protein
MLHVMKEKPQIGCCNTEKKKTTCGSQNIEEVLGSTRFTAKSRLTPVAPPDGPWKLLTSLYHIRDVTSLFHELRHSSGEENPSS